MKRRTFDQLLDELDHAELTFARGVALATVAVQRAAVLPWPIRTVLRWRGRRVIAKGTRHLLRVRDAKNRLLANEQEIRDRMARDAVWGPQA